MSILFPFTSAPHSKARIRIKDSDNREKPSNMT